MSLCKTNTFPGELAPQLLCHGLTGCPHSHVHSYLGLWHLCLMPSPCSRFSSVSVSALVATLCIVGQKSFLSHCSSYTSHLQIVSHAPQDQVPPRGNRSRPSRPRPTRHGPAPSASAPASRPGARFSGGAARPTVPLSGPQSPSMWDEAQPAPRQTWLGMWDRTETPPGRASSPPLTPLLHATCSTHTECTERGATCMQPSEFHTQNVQCCVVCVLCRASTSV